MRYEYYPCVSEQSAFTSGGDAMTSARALPQQVSRVNEQARNHDLICIGSCDVLRH